MLSLINGRKQPQPPIPKVPPARLSYVENGNHPYGSDSRNRESLKKSLGLDILVAFIKEPTQQHEAKLREQWNHCPNLQELIPDPQKISPEFAYRKELCSAMLDNLQTSFIENTPHLALGDLFKEYENVWKGVRK